MKDHTNMDRAKKTKISQPFNPHVATGSRALVRHGKYKEETGEWEALEDGELEVIVAWATREDEEEYRRLTGGESLIVDWAKRNALHPAYHTIDIYPVEPRRPPWRISSKSRDCVRLFPRGPRDGVDSERFYVDEAVDFEGYEGTSSFELTGSPKFQVFERDGTGWFWVSRYGDNLLAEAWMSKWEGSLPSKYESDERIEKYEEPDVKRSPSFWELSGYYGKEEKGASATRKPKQEENAQHWRAK